MYTAIVGTHLVIPKAALADIEQVKRDLTIVADESTVMFRPSWPGQPPPEPRKAVLWEDIGDHLALPRGYTPLVKGHVEILKPQGEMLGFLPPLAPRRVLRRTQTGAWAALTSREWRGRDKLLCLSPGKGKSYLALCYALEQRKRTLIIVDRDFLIGQWKREILQTTGIEGSHVGVIQGPTATVGERFSVAMIQTLIRWTDEELLCLNDHVDLVVFDEAHVSGAEQASRILPFFRGERLALSATPTRPDGMHPAYMWHCGGLEPCFTDLTRDKPSTWCFLSYPTARAYLTERQMAGMYRNVPGLPSPALVRAKFDTAVCNSSAFAADVLTEVAAAARGGRRILVLGTRTEFLKKITDLAQMMNIDASLVIGPVKGPDREKAFGAQVIFVTSSIASKALDIKELDTLFLLFPIHEEGALRQTVGRIERMADGKKSPLVVVWTHDYNRSLARKVEKMKTTVRQMDQSAKLRDIRKG